MEIKATPGQTLLTLLRVAIFAVAACSVFGMQSVADSFFDFFRGEGGLLAPEREEPAPAYGEPYVLYYERELSRDNYQHIYRQYYISGSEGSLGLVDAAGNVLLPREYQDIIVLPESYLLKQQGQWRFYSHTLEPLSENSWEQVEISLNDSGKLSSDLVKVSADGLYGAADLLGNIEVEARWESLELYTFAAGWPLMRVSSGGQYGYIDADGEVAVSVSYDYARMGQYSPPGMEQGGEEEPIPVIFVCRDGDWGGIFREKNGPTDVDWSVEPPEEILEDYADILPQ